MQDNLEKYLQTIKKPQVKLPTYKANLRRALLTMDSAAPENTGKFFNLNFLRKLAIISLGAIALFTGILLLNVKNNDTLTVHALIAKALATQQQKQQQGPYRNIQFSFTMHYYGTSNTFLYQVIDEIGQPYRLTIEKNTENGEPLVTYLFDQRPGADPSKTGRKPALAVNDGRIPIGFAINDGIRVKIQINNTLFYIQSAPFVPLSFDLVGFLKKNQNIEEIDEYILSNGFRSISPEEYNSGKYPDDGFYAINPLLPGSTMDPLAIFTGLQDETGVKLLPEKEINDINAVGLAKDITINGKQYYVEAYFDSSSYELRQLNYFVVENFQKKSELEYNIDFIEYSATEPVSGSNITIVPTIPVTVTAKPTVQPTSKPVAETKDCRQDFSCFIAASENCSPAQVIQTTNIIIEGFSETSTSNLQIRGMNENKCIFYQRILNVDLVFPTYTPPDTIAEQTALLKSVIGKEATCRFDQAGLTAMLNNWAKGNLSSGDLTADKCSGSLLGN